MKDNTKKKAPHVAIPSKKKPFQFFRENTGIPSRKSGQQPMMKKRLAK